MSLFGLPTWSDFPAVYLVLMLCALVGTRALQHMLGVLVDERRIENQAVGSASAAPTMLRLREGDLPRGDQAYLVACARGTLYSALVAGARAEGWITDDGGLRRDARPQSEMQRRFFDFASGRGGPTESVAREFARLVTPGLTETLKRQGLVRSDLSRWSAFLASLAVGAGLIAWGVVAAPTGGGTIVMLVRGLLYVVTAAAFFGLGVFGGLTRFLSVRGRGYLDWLEGATVALAAEARSGALRTHDDVALAAAMESFTARLPP